MAKAKKKPAKKKAAKSVKRNAPRPKPVAKKKVSARVKAARLANLAKARAAKKKTVKRAAPKAKASKRNPKKKSRRNGDAAAAERYEYFHGREPGVVTDIETSIKTHATLSGIGKLVALFIDTPVTGPSTRVKLENFRGALLAQDAKGKQLYIEGGDQKVNLADFKVKDPHERETLGYLAEVWYDTIKDHLGNSGGDAVYKHRFGRNKPVVVYDVMNKLLSLAGGGYDLPEVGIRG